MDLSRTIGYRGFALNTVQFDAVTRDMVGCEVRTVEYGNVPAVGYDEKRAMADGRDVSDLYLDRRLISMAGSIYGRTRAEAYRLYRSLSAAMTPTAAYEENPGQRGYLPMDFYQPVDITADFPSGLIHVMMFVRPMAGLSARFDADVHGGDDNKALAIPWNAQLDARVPDIVNYDYTTKSLAGLGNGTFSMRNRGNRPATVEVRLICPANFGNDGGLSWVRINIGGDDFRILIPNTSGTQNLFYDTHAKVVAQWSTRVLRMDLIELMGGDWHPKMQPGNNTVRFTKEAGSKDLMAGSYIRFRDTFA